MIDMEDKVAPEVDLEALTRQYLDAFEARDLERCVGFFHEDATIDFQNTIYRGRKGIEDWHKDRFAANLKMIRLDSITVNGDTVLVDGAAASKRLAAWKISSLNGRITIRFEDGKIRQGKLAPRLTNPIDLLRSGQ
jgi:ketosteroid isomerase-like protein